MVISGFLRQLLLLLAAGRVELCRELLAHTLPQRLLILLLMGPTFGSPLLSASFSRQVLRCRIKRSREDYLITSTVFTQLLSIEAAQLVVVTSDNHERSSPVTWRYKRK